MNPDIFKVNLVKLLYDKSDCLQHTAPFLQLLLSFPSRPGGVFASSLRPSPTPVFSCDFQACSATYNIMHHDACAHTMMQMSLRHQLKAGPYN